MDVKFVRTPFDLSETHHQEQEESLISEVKFCTGSKNF